MSSSTTQVARSASRPAYVTAWSCAIVLAIALGVGRFAFTPLLPVMLASGVLDIRHGGWLASANYAGYLSGALCCAAFRVSPGRMVRFSLLATIALTLAMGVTNTFWLWAGIRFLAGVVSAWAFVFASQWGLGKLAVQNGAPLAGIIYAGSGIGILATGLLGAVAGSLGISARAAWVAFALMSALAAAMIWRSFVDQLAPDVSRVAQADNVSLEVKQSDVPWLIGLYSLAGFGYIITATFLPVIARQALPGSNWPDFFWPAFGLALIVGALAAARLPPSWDNRRLLAACYIMQALGIIIGIVSPTVPGLCIGSLMLGLPFTAITMFAMREARRLRGDEAAGLMGYATGSYGLGQIIGPLIAAPIAAHTGSFAYSLWIAVFALATGAVGFAYLGSRSNAPARPSDARPSSHR